MPGVPILRVREREVDRLRSCVEQEQEIVVEDAASVRVGFADGIAVVEDHRRARTRLVPFLLRHVRARRREPLDLAERGLAAALCGSLQETSAAHHRVIAAQVNEVAGETQEVVVVLIQIPVDPRELVVLAVRVVVASLGAAQLVSVGDHRHTLGEHEGRQEIALLAVAQLDDLLVIRVALNAAVPRTVVVRAIRAALEVCLVVLLVVRHEVAQREAVVGGDEVDGCHGLAARRPVQVGGASQAGGEVG